MSNYNKETKKCYSCLQELPRSNFGVDRGERDGFNRYCKSCRFIIFKYRRSPEKVYLYELPCTYRNHAVLQLIEKGKIHTFETETPDITITLDTTKDFMEFKCENLKTQQLLNHIKFVANSLPASFTD